MARYKFDIIKKMDELLEIMKEHPPTALYMTQKQFDKYHIGVGPATYRGIPIEVVK